MVELGDKGGSFNASIFGDSPVFPVLKGVREGVAVRVLGQTEWFNDRLSPRLAEVHILDEKELAESGALDRLVSASPLDANELWEELQGHVAALQRPSVRAAIEILLADLGSTFRETPAAVSMHHAYRHGLMEHTVRMCRAARALLPLYPEVDHDLALAGIIAHDTGKTIEYTGALAAKRTRKGLLQGHVVLGYRLLRGAALKAKLDPDLLERLEHVVLSHQGELEWGAAVMAATPEAVFVSMVDNLDAKMGMVQNTLRNAGGEEFSDFMPGLKASLLLTPPPPVEPVAE
jgi:3'-5' exoribonuclease